MPITVSMGPGLRKTSKRCAILGFNFLNLMCNRLCVFLSLIGERFAKESEWLVEYESYPWTTVKDYTNYTIPLHAPGNIAHVSFHAADSRGYKGFLFKYYAIGMITNIPTLMPKIEQF